MEEYICKECDERVVTGEICRVEVETEMNTFYSMSTMLELGESVDLYHADCWREKQERSHE